MHTKSANLNVNVLYRGMLTLAVTISATGRVKGALFWTEKLP